MAVPGIWLLLGAVVLGVGIVWLRRHHAFNLRQKYALNLVQLLIITFCAVQLLHLCYPTLNLPSMLVGGSALVVAIVGYAAQPVIMNMISGLLLSFDKTIEVGDRIVVAGEEPGIVEDITLRHTVLRTYDGIRIIIPNGELNAKTVTSLSYHMKDRRGIHLRFCVSFDTDIGKAMEIIRDCVAESPYTLGFEADGMSEDSGWVYFLEMGSSAVILRTTIWIDRQTNSHLAATDVNLRVFNAFRRYGIEIPYPYVNVIAQEKTDRPSAEIAVKATPASPLRHRRSETVRMPCEENRVEEAVRAARTFALQQNLKEQDIMQVELLTEEMTELMHRLLGRAQRDFWVDGTGKILRLHARASTKPGSVEEYKKLVELSSTGHNDGIGTLNQRIMEAIMLGRRRIEEKGDKHRFEWSLSSDEINEDKIGRSILTSLADDIRISVKEDSVELLVVKTIP